MTQNGGGARERVKPRPPRPLLAAGESHVTSLLSAGGEASRRLVGGQKMGGTERGRDCGDWVRGSQWARRAEEFEGRRAMAAAKSFGCGGSAAGMAVVAPLPVPASTSRLPVRRAAAKRAAPGSPPVAPEQVRPASPPRGLLCSSRPGVTSALPHRNAPAPASPHRSHQAEPRCGR